MSARTETGEAGSVGPADADPPGWHKTACILCECNCGLEIQLDGRRLAKVRGDREHPASAGYTCEKPLRLDRYQNDPGRLTSPLRRRPDGEYEPVDWDTAISEITARLSRIRDEFGGRSIFFYGGGGQGNHLGGAYGRSLRSALGARFSSNALAQEKTGEMWVDGRLYGGHTKGDFEHSEVVLFLGKNPWQSHSFPRARPTLKAIAADPERAMIVIDPRRSETAAMADHHLQVRPGTDAWCLAAMLGVLVQERLVDRAFVEAHTGGADQVLAVLADVPVAAYAQRCGVDETLIREATRRFAAAATATTYEDLGVQQAPNSTLVSYLNKLLWILTGNFGRPGTMYLHSSLISLIGSGAGPAGTGGATGSGGVARGRVAGLRRVLRRTGAAGTRSAARGVSAVVAALAGLPATEVVARATVDRLAPLLGSALSGSGGSRSADRTTPVTGAPVIGGLIPCNAIADEILTDHPDRFRAMWIDSANPAHSLADSRRFAEALRSLDCVVVVDVALTETARMADYVLPASTQFEKWEATFFNFEFPRNVFHLRPPALDPEPGTLPEPEIYARVLRELDAVDTATLGRLRRAATAGRGAYTLTLFSTLAARPSLSGLVPHLLYETLGPTLPRGARAAALLWGASHLCALSQPDAVARAGFTGPGLQAGEQLFEAILTRPQGTVFTVDDWEHVWNYVRRPGRRFTVAIPALLDTLGDLDRAGSSWTSEEFPMVLSAGERRSFTANTIIRDPGWRRRDPDGALRISPVDAERLGLDAADRVRVVTETGRAETGIEITDTMQAGHISLPNGFGLDHVGEDGFRSRRGVAPNDLTSVRLRDPIAGTPWHKYVPARVEPVVDRPAPTHENGPR